MQKIGVALLGLGTVGGGTYRILTANRDNIKKHEGLDIEIKHILERNMDRVRSLNVDPSIVSTDIDNIINNPDIKIVAEFFGGIEPAKTFLIKSLKAGKSIVTANKELFSKYWGELEAAAKEGNAGLYFEASCVGGVPIIRALTESMQANNIISIMGIVNGTTNYILSKMSDEGLPYEEVLAEAQRLGYAEANPSADVDGYDATYKLSILSSLAFHTKVPIKMIYREGISKITKEDIACGRELGYTIKLLAITKKVNGKLESHVNPCFVSNTHPLSSVKGSFNAVFLVGDNVGDIMLYGRGAGDLPTGSAIVSDICFAAKQKKHRYADFKNVENVNEKLFNRDFESKYFIRMTVNDESGVLASVTKIFAKNKVSIDVMKQTASSGGKANIFFITHMTSESKAQKSVEEIKELSSVYKVDSLIRVI